MLTRLARRTFYSTRTQLPPLVSSEWLSTQLDRENVKVVDGSFHLPKAGRDAAKEFSQQRIPGATFFDLNEIKDKTSKLPRMMPTQDEFEVAMCQIGLKHDDIIIIYDCAGIFSSPRVWYMLKSMGAKNVHVLNGGFPIWKKEGRPVEEGPMTGGYQKEKQSFSGKFNKQSFVNYRDINRIIAGVNLPGCDHDEILILDARAVDRFVGSIDEGDGMKAGHIPTSVNLFYKSLLQEDGLHFKNSNELRKLFNDRRIDITKPIVSTCGSGVTAAVINFAIACVQYEDYKDELDPNFQPLRLYDGSWAEWGSRKDSQVATTPFETYHEKGSTAFRTDPRNVG
eukprot:311533_1